MVTVNISHALLEICLSTMTIDIMAWSTCSCGLFIAYSFLLVK